jgi:hypothetical protein
LVGALSASTCRRVVRDDGSILVTDEEIVNKLEFEPCDHPWSSPWRYSSHPQPFIALHSRAATMRNSSAPAHSLLRWPLLPLATSISCDLWVVLYKLAGREMLSTVGALVTATILLGLWFVMPLAIRRSKANLA